MRLMLKPDTTILLETLPYGSKSDSILYLRQLQQQDQGTLSGTPQ
jgi:hypothetical protein